MNQNNSEPHTPGLANHPENSPILVKKGTLNQDRDILVCIGPDCQNDPDVKREQKDLALNLLLLDKVDDALKMIEESISKYPEDSVYYSLKGECLIKQWKYQEALEVLDKAIQLDDKNAVAHLNKGVALIQIEKYQLGIQEIDISLTLNPKSVKALNTKGNALYELDDLAEAIKCWKMALEIDPQYDQAYNNIGIALDEQGRHKDSLVYFSKAIEISPNHPLYYCNKGIAQLSLDQDLALNDFKKAKNLLEDPINLQQITKSNQAYIQERILMITELEEKKRKFRDLLKKLNVKQETYDNITATLLKVDDKAKTEYLNSMQDDKSDTISQMQKQLEEIQKLLDKTGLTEKYKMKLALDEMEQNGGINGNLQKEYYCTFYWTLLEYLTAYQQLSLNVFKSGDAAYQFDKSKQDQSKQILIEMGAKYIGAQVKKFAEKIPIVGNIIGYLDEAVDKVLSIRKENIFLKKISAINDIIKYKKGETLVYEDLSLTLQSAAFQLCEKQKDDIVNRVKSKQQHIGQPVEPTEAWKVFINALTEFKDKILATNKTDMFQGEASAMALEDVLSVLVYFFDQYELIVNSTDKLSSIIVTLVLTQKAKTYIVDQISKGLPGVLPHIQEEQTMKGENENCCTLI